MNAFTSRDGRLTFLRLPPGSDLYAEITQAAKELGIRWAGVNVIGALSSLSYGYYDQQEHEYRRLEHEGELEIASAVGNLSLKDGEPFLHMHLVAAGPDGSTMGGHLFGGTVFVAEVAFQVFEGDGPVREPDRHTELDLWPAG